LYESLSDEDKKIYNRSVENRRIEESIDYTKELEATHKATVKIAKNAIRKGLDNEFISELTGLTVEQIEELRNTL